MVKVSRPSQDMRWDVPVVGPETIKILAENNFSALAIESGRMFVVDPERLVRDADLSGIAVQVLA
jgi:UDP-2,3-diacylglucosamine hydrolase